MIFRIFPPTSTFHGVAYNERKQQKGKGKLVYFEGFGHLQFGRGRIDAREFKAYLETHCAVNRRIKNPQFHAILSCPGRGYSHEQLKDLALKLMERLGYGNNPILVYGHSDTDNNHVHIVTARVDRKGKKIPDNFEGKRAGSILAELIQLTPEKDFEKDLAESTAYRFNTPAQFLLLMEQKGYSVKKQETDYVFYKYGKKLGCIAKAVVAGLLSPPEMDGKREARIWALIYKYKAQYASSLVSNKSERYTTERLKLHSPLTAFLHGRLGLEFVFFTGKGHEKPYGYALIDHPGKTVYKGGDIFPLQALIGEWKGEEKSIFTPSDTSIETANKAPRLDDGPRENTEKPTEEQPSIENQESLAEGLDYIIGGVLYWADKANEQSGKKRVIRRKRK